MQHNSYLFITCNIIYITVIKYIQFLCITYIYIYIFTSINTLYVLLLFFTHQVNGMFQTPTCILMNLDSSIVQLNFFSPLLLVSTLARCYICDTVQEQYKQIGNKPRNGEFGACFYKIHENTALNLQKEERNINDTRSAFNLISNNDSNILGEENHAKIFCARPGSRLWEVSADGIVVKTHQFKEALAIPPIPIFRLAGTLESSQKEETEREWPPQSINFSHLLVIARRYLFSYTNSGVYIIDPISASVSLWSNEYINIAMTAVVDDRIYLMTCDSEFHCLALSSLDSLILRLYRHERYSECLNACFVYKSLLLKAVDSKEIVELFEMEDLPQISRDEEALLLLRPLITLLQTNSNNKPAKLDSGIVVVHSENEGFTNRTYGCETMSALQSPETSSEDSSEMQIMSGKDRDENLAREDTLETTSADVLDLDEEVLGNIKDDNRENLHDPQQSIMHKIQSDLQPIYDLANSVRPSMSEKEIEEIVLETDKLMRTIKESYKNSSGLQSFIYEITRAAELHYYNTFLENASVQLLDSISNDLIVRQFARAFIQINASAYARCSCGYPYPMDKTVEPKFLTIGKSLIKRYVDVDLLKECNNICDQVPYMWREYLAVRIERRNTLDDVLRQCLQTRDKVVLSFLLPALNEQQWNCISTCLDEIEEGTCLFCAMPLTEKPDYNILIDWSGIAREIMKREGPDEATAFLIKLESMMPNVTFDRRY